MKKVTDSEKKIFDDLITLSNAVETLYVRLYRIECREGKDSEEYKKNYDYLLIALDTETSFIERNLSTSDMYSKALSYFDSLEMKPKRSIKKIKYSRDYLEKSVDFLSSFMFYQSKINFSIAKKIFLDKKEREHFFELIHFIDCFSFMDSDLESLSVDEGKNIILLKYDLCILNPIAESIFLGNIPIEVEMAKNDNLASIYLGISKFEYTEYFHEFFIERLKDNVSAFKNDPNVADGNFLSLIPKYEIRTIIFELGKNDALDCFLRETAENNVQNPKLNSIFYSEYSSAEEYTSKTIRDVKSKKYTSN